MYDEDFTITQFDPNDGIWFKYGRVYLNREVQIADFEAAAGYRLPHDFLEMIGEWCEGGFDGHYRVNFEDGVEISWHGLLLMKLADELDGLDTLDLIRAKPTLFGKPGDVRFFPFGRAYESRSLNEMNDGYLAFDVVQDNAVVFMPADGGTIKNIARSFREMMESSSFVFYG